MRWVNISLTPREKKGLQVNLSLNRKKIAQQNRKIVLWTFSAEVIDEKT